MDRLIENRTSSSLPVQSGKTDVAIARDAGSPPKGRIDHKSVRMQFSVRVPKSIKRPSESFVDDLPSLGIGRIIDLPLREFAQFGPESPAGFGIDGRSAAAPALFLALLLRPDDLEHDLTDQ